MVVIFPLLRDHFRTGHVTFAGSVINETYEYCSSAVPFGVTELSVVFPFTRKAKQLLMTGNDRPESVLSSCPAPKAQFAMLWCDRLPKQRPLWKASFSIVSKCSLSESTDFQASDLGEEEKLCRINILQYQQLK